ncbi:hypothetical protein F610DRAFT_02644 [Streptomyces sp. LaPpAH-199]|nr:hypothetical protein [Streptomyces sp. DSM 41269]SDC73600.1 hypothetical protein F610DRAFT_02644 [Streptomyces sp. LaPpAH-199]
MTIKLFSGFRHDKRTDNYLPARPGAAGLSAPLAFN